MFYLGFFVSYLGLVLILLWLGMYKFTPTEARAIRPLVEHSPLTFWVYHVLSEQAVSNGVGIVEILLGVLLLVSLKKRGLLPYVSYGLVFMFAVTISYLFSTPGMWKVVDGLLIANFFILKDLIFLGFALLLAGGLSACRRLPTASPSC